MRSPQVLVYEGDGRLAGQLRDPVKEHRWTLREPRSSESCLKLLRLGGPSVVVLKLGRDFKAEMRLLEQAAWLHPDTAIVVVSDSDNPLMMGLAWDLGAHFVLSPPQPRAQLPEIVAGLMEAAVQHPPLSPPRSSRTDSSGNNSPEAPEGGSG